MEAVRDYSNIDFNAIVLHARAPCYNGVTSFDIEYDERGPLIIANAVPIVVIKGVRTDSEGRDYIIVSRKNMPAEMVDPLNNVALHIARTQANPPTGYTPVFGGDSAAIGLAHDFKLFDKAGNAIADYKNKSGYYRIMFTFDCATLSDGVVTAMPKIQQMQYMEEVKQTFDQCYWTPAIQIQVRKPRTKKAVGSTTDGEKKPVAGGQVRKQRVPGNVDKPAKHRPVKSKKIP